MASDFPGVGPGFNQKNLVPGKDLDIHCQAADPLFLISSAELCGCGVFGSAQLLLNHHPIYGFIRTNP